MKNIIVCCMLLLALPSKAETFTVISPQKPGEGTSQWTDIVVKELQKHMANDKLSVRYYPGARALSAPNDFQEDLRFDDQNILVTNGGNGISFVLEGKAEYNYADWDSVGIMNLNIIVSKRKDSDKVVFASRAGRVPDTMGMALLLCRPESSIDDYIKCFKDNVKWVKGMSQGEIRLAFRRGELTVDRENPAAHKKHVEPNSDMEVWFHHGILQADGSHADDPNYKGYQLEALYKKKWGVAPKGRFYNAYKLIKSYRDSIQKSIWVNKNNPNRANLIKGIYTVINDPISRKAIEKKVGNYNWVIGDEGNKQIETLKQFVTEQSLKDLVRFTKGALGLNSVYKEYLLE